VEYNNSGQCPLNFGKKNNYVDHGIRVRGVNLSLALQDGTSYLVLNIWSACQRFVFNGLLEIVTSLCCPDLVSNNALSRHILDCYLFSSAKCEDMVLGLLSANVCGAQVRLRIRSQKTSWRQNPGALNAP
jgi:hypothetical protein